jgi:hypothetical protein
MKNYTTSVTANRSIAEIQEALVKYGATGVLYEYEQGTGRIAALRFRQRVHDQDVRFFPAGTVATVPECLGDVAGPSLGRRGLCVPRGMAQYPRLSHGAVSSLRDRDCGERIGKTNGLLAPPLRLRASAGNHSSRAPLPSPPARHGNPIRVAWGKVQRGKAWHGQADQESGGLCLNVVHNRAEGRNFQPPLAVPGHMGHRRSSCMCIPYRGGSDGADKWLYFLSPPCIMLWSVRSVPVTRGIS